MKDVIKSNLLYSIMALIVIMFSLSMSILMFSNDISILSFLEFNLSRDKFTFSFGLQLVTLFFAPGIFLLTKTESKLSIVLMAMLSILLVFQQSVELILFIYFCILLISKSKKNILNFLYALACGVVIFLSLGSSFFAWLPFLMLLLNCFLPSKSLGQELVILLIFIITKGSSIQIGPELLSVSYVVLFLLSFKLRSINQVLFIFSCWTITFVPWSVVGLMVFILFLYSEIVQNEAIIKKGRPYFFAVLAVIISMILESITTNSLIVVSIFLILMIIRYKNLRPINGF